MLTASGKKDDTANGKIMRLTNEVELDIQGAALFRRVTSSHQSMTTRELHPRIRDERDASVRAIARAAARAESSAD